MHLSPIIGRVPSEPDSAALWAQRLRELRVYRTLHGHVNVPKAAGALGRWVVRQRELHKKGKLEPSRTSSLASLGFVWNTNEAAWAAKYSLLRSYLALNGHVCVPIADRSLGMWVAKMRATRRRGKLSQARIDALDRLAFVWNTAEADWLDKYDRLRAFKAREGHACVPFNEGELGWWVNTQRQNKRKGKLMKHREGLLDEAGFVWRPQEFLAGRRRAQAVARAARTQMEATAREDCDAVAESRAAYKRPYLDVLAAGYDRSNTCSPMSVKRAKPDSPRWISSPRAVGHGRARHSIASLLSPAPGSPVTPLARTGPAGRPSAGLRLALSAGVHSMHRGSPRPRTLLPPIPALHVFADASVRP